MKISAARFSLGSTLTAPLTADTKPNHTYYLGASDTPDLVLVLRVAADQIVYVKGRKRCVIQRWVGEDLIARGGATIARTLTSESWPSRPTGPTSLRSRLTGAGL